jgi:hypothetical protein
MTRFGSLLACAFIQTMPQLIDAIYATAAAQTAKTEAELRAMALQVFATMLHHAMQAPDRPLWTVMQIGECGFYVEVNLPRRDLREAVKFTPASPAGMES